MRSRSHKTLSGGILLLASLLALPAFAAVTPWAKLLPIQREALSPLAAQWDTLPENQQQKLLALTKRYPQLTVEQKQRMHSRIEAWSKLTHEQRVQARQKYAAFSKVPPDKREEVKHMVRQQEAEKKAAASAPLAVSEPAATTGK